MVAKGIYPIDNSKCQRRKIQKSRSHNSTVGRTAANFRIVKYSITKTIKIELALEDGQWVVQESDAMADALTGGMLSWANSVNNAG